MPRLKGVSFETAIIERYRRRESSVEEALIEMYLAGVSVQMCIRDRSRTTAPEIERFQGLLSYSLSIATYSKVIVFRNWI